MITNKDITAKIENDFGWLTPDEKQKLYSLLISVWNDAVSDIAAITKVTLYNDDQIVGETDQYTHYNFNNDKIVCKVNKNAINALKLKI